MTHLLGVEEESDCARLYAADKPLRGLRLIADLKKERKAITRKFDKISFVVSGTVQGVCFRAYAQAAAVELDVTGWIRNRRDGRVEGEAFGSPEAVKGFIEWLHKGSPYGRVDQVEVESLESQGSRPPNFGVRY